jgi:lipopolysaccharide export LptBFGC system permease protein LptF
MLGFKHSEEFILYSSQIRRGKSQPKSNSSTTSSSTSRIINQETINKLTQRSKGVMIKVFDKNGNFINKFSNMTEAAKFYGVTSASLFN